MSKHIKDFIPYLLLWIFCQAVAWFYGGKDAAGATAAIAGVTLTIIYGFSRIAV